MTTPHCHEDESSDIIRDLHRIRESIAASFGNDLHQLAADARARQRQSGRVVWRREVSPKDNATNIGDVDSRAKI